jgi:hypothetical protein
MGIYRPASNTIHLSAHKARGMSRVQGSGPIRERAPLSAERQAALRREIAEERALERLADDILGVTRSPMRSHKVRVTRKGAPKVSSAVAEEVAAWQRARVRKSAEDERREAQEAIRRACLTGHGVVQRELPIEAPEINTTADMR